MRRLWSTWRHSWGWLTGGWTTTVHWCASDAVSGMSCVPVFNFISTKYSRSAAVWQLRQYSANERTFTGWEIQTAWKVKELGTGNLSSTFYRNSRQIPVTAERASAFCAAADLVGYYCLWTTNDPALCFDTNSSPTSQKWQIYLASNSNIADIRHAVELLQRRVSPSVNNLNYWRLRRRFVHSMFSFLLCGSNH